MEQRRVRLGDVLDDYCPRERRVTNHVVVAIVDNDIKLTRCTTCDTEHPYKAARVPPRRQTPLVAALSNAGADGALIAAPPAPPKPPPPAATSPAAASPAVAPGAAASPGIAPPAARPLAAGSPGVAPPAARPLAAGFPGVAPPAARPLAAGSPGVASPAARPLAAGSPGVAPPAARPLAAGSPGIAPPAARPLAAGSPGVAASDATLPDVPLPVVSRPSKPPHVDSVRRPLIRATLGRPDPAVATRPAPVFTMRENEGRAGNADRGNASRRRRNGSRPGGEPNGNRAEGYPGQFTRSGYGKNESKPARRSGNGRPERFNKASSRSRGKSRSR